MSPTKTTIVRGAFSDANCDNRRRSGRRHRGSRGGGARGCRGGVLKRQRMLLRIALNELSDDFQNCQPTDEAPIERNAIDSNQLDILPKTQNYKQMDNDIRRNKKNDKRSSVPRAHNYLGERYQHSNYSPYGANDLLGSCVALSETENTTTTRGYFDEAKCESYYKKSNYTYPQQMRHFSETNSENIHAPHREYFAAGGGRNQHSFNHGRSIGKKQKSFMEKPTNCSQLHFMTSNYHLKPTTSSQTNPDFFRSETVPTSNYHEIGIGNNFVPQHLPSARDYPLHQIGVYPPRAGYLRMNNYSAASKTHMERNTIRHQKPIELNSTSFESALENTSNGQNHAGGTFFNTSPRSFLTGR